MYPHSLQENPAKKTAYNGSWFKRVKPFKPLKIMQNKNKKKHLNLVVPACPDIASVDWLN